MWKKKPKNIYNSHRNWKTIWLKYSYEQGEQETDHICLSHAFYSLCIYNECCIITHVIVKPIQEDPEIKLKTN